MYLTAKTSCSGALIQLLTITFAEVFMRKKLQENTPETTVCFMYCTTNSSVYLAQVAKLVPLILITPFALGMVAR